MFMAQELALRFGLGGSRPTTSPQPGNYTKCRTEGAFLYR